MNKRITQLFAFLAFVCILTMSVLPGMRITSFAANGSIQFSDPSATVGSEVSVNLKVASSGGEALSRADIALTYDANALEFLSGNSVEGGSGALRAHGSPDAGSPSTIVFTMKFRTKQAGSSQITVTSQEVYDSDSQMVTMNHVGNSTVTVQAVSNASGNAALASLQVSPGTLSPEFSADVDSYSVNVGLDVERLTVNVVPADENAAYVVTGNEDLQEGENTVVCRVTAQNGTTVKDYTIMVLKNAEGASAASGAGDPGAVTEIISLEAAAKSISIIPLGDGVALPEGFSETVIDIDGRKVTGWIWASESNAQYCVFYGMNAAGEKYFYRYDLTEKTIQRYFQDPAIDTGVTQEDHAQVITQYNELLESFKLQRMIMVALIAVVLVLFIIMVYLIIRGAGKNPPPTSGSSREMRGRGDERADFSDWEEEESFGEEERYMRGREDEYDGFSAARPEPVKRRRPPENGGQNPGPGRSSSRNMGEEGQPVVRREPRPELEATIVRPLNTRPAGRPVSAHREGPVQDSARPVRNIRPAGAPVPGPSHYTRPQRPVPPEPETMPENAEEDDDFEFLDIDD